MQTIIYDKANELYEYFERDYKSFACSKQRAMLFCQKKMNIAQIIRISYFG